jgi:hypothetical protein
MCTCIKCKRPLKNPKSVRIGFGPVCLKAHENEFYLNALNKYLTAKDDGFVDFDEMFDWFEKVHGLPFTGQLIKW